MIDFMERLAKGQIQAAHNLQHSEITLDTAIIENWQAPEDFVMNGEVIHKGSWVQGTKVYDEEIRKAIDEGVITGYSIEGTGRKALVE